MLNFLWGWVLDWEEAPPCLYPTPKGQNPILSGILSVSSSLFPSFPAALRPDSRPQKQRSLSPGSMTSWSKAKTFACGLPKCPNSFPNSSLPMVTPVIYCPSLQSHPRSGAGISVQNQIPALSDPFIANYPFFPIAFPSLMDPFPWPINIFKSLPSSIFFSFKDPISIDR